MAQAKIVSQHKLKQLLPTAYKENWPIPFLSEKCDLNRRYVQKEVEKYINNLHIQTPKSINDFSDIIGKMSREALEQRGRAIERLSRLENVLENKLVEAEASVNPSVRELRELVSAFKTHWSLTSEVTGVKLMEKITEAKAGQTQIKLDIGNLGSDSVKKLKSTYQN